MTNNQSIKRLKVMLFIVRNCVNDVAMTYVILRQVRMIRLNAVVEDRHNNSLSGIAFLPGGDHVHVEALEGASVLQ